MDSVDCLMANTRNNPIEELDMRFPMRCDRYELRDDPAAPGQWRGGIGIVRKNRFLEPGVYSCEGDRHTDPPRGIFGGYDGLPAKSTFIDKDGNEQDIPAKVTGCLCGADDVIQLTEPNAGGYGNPLDRERADGARRRARRLHHHRARARGLRRRDLGGSRGRREAATDELRAKLRSERGDGFQGELLTLVSTPHPLAVSPVRGDVTEDSGYGDYGTRRRSSPAIVPRSSSSTTRRRSRPTASARRHAADRARRRQHRAAAAGRARDAACPCSSSTSRSARRRAGSGCGAARCRSSREIAAGTPWVEIDGRLLDPSDAVIAKKWPSVFPGTPLASLLNAQRVDTVIVSRLHDVGLRPRHDRRRVLERLPHARAEDAVGDQAQGPHDANLLDCQRRYCEVTTADACIEYLRRRAAA